MPERRHEAGHVGVSLVNQYLNLVNQAVRAWPSRRVGQAFFNVLCEVEPLLAERVRATEFDPFYQDKRIPAFLEFVEQRIGNA